MQQSLSFNYHRSNEDDKKGRTHSCTAQSAASRHTQGVVFLPLPLTRKFVFAPAITVPSAIVYIHRSMIDGFSGHERFLVADGTRPVEFICVLH